MAFRHFGHRPVPAPRAGSAAPVPRWAGRARGVPPGRRRGSGRGQAADVWRRSAEASVARPPAPGIVRGRRAL